MALLAGGSKKPSQTIKTWTIPKRLNVQTWALFFTRFKFTVTYLPGTNKGKADTISHRHDSITQNITYELILLPSIVIALIQWDIMEEIQCAQAAEAPPLKCPPTKLYIPVYLHRRIIQEIHKYHSFAHPDKSQTTRLAQNTFWWPTLAVDVRRYVEASSIYAQSKTPCQLPAGLLELLFVPQQPWSQVDFVTDLPISHSINLVTVSWLFKSCKMVPLQGLPTPMETAKALVTHAFSTYGLPKNIVTDWRPQFMTQIWEAFCKSLNINISLTSAYHP